MPATVRLKDIVDALEMQFDESSAFLDLDFGRVETISHALLREAENSGDEEPDLLHGRNTNGRLPSESFLSTASRSFPQS